VSNATINSINACEKYPESHHERSLGAFSGEDKEGVASLLIG